MYVKKQENQTDGGPLVTMAPQQAVRLPHKGCAWYSLHTWTYTMTAIMTAVNIGNVRNWHSTQSCAQVAITDRWPWQLWCTQSLHSVSVVCEISWIWSDENISIGKNTANKIYADICLRIVFTAAKILKIMEIFFIFTVNLLFLQKISKKFRKFGFEVNISMKTLWR